jgi:hypothetical protein
MKIDPRYSEGQIKILKRAIEHCKKSKDINGVNFYTELLEKGSVDFNQKQPNNNSVEQFKPNSK